MNLNEKKIKILIEIFGVGKYFAIDFNSTFAMTGIDFVSTVIANFESERTSKLIIWTEMKWIELLHDDSIEIFPFQRDLK